MAKIRFTSIKPGLVFEHEGVKVKAVQSIPLTGCIGCILYNNTSKCIPCTTDKRIPKQKHNLIFKKVEDDQIHNRL